MKRAFLLMIVIASVSFPFLASAQHDATRISNDIFTEFGYGVSQKPQPEPVQQSKKNRTIADIQRELAKLMVETDLLDDPAKLLKLANAATAYGIEDQLPPFAELAQKAKRRAEMKTFQSLMVGNVDEAIDAAKLSGSAFADRPVKLKPNDPNDFAWKILQEGGVETVVNVKTMFELYSQIAQSENNDHRVAADRRASRQERKAQLELIEEQKRALSEQRRRSSTEDLRDMLLIDRMLAPGRF